MCRLMTFLLLLVLSGVTTAHLKAEMHLEGILKNKWWQGTVPDGQYKMTFSLWDSAHEGRLLWSEDHTVLTDKGAFSIVLGRRDALPGLMRTDTTFLGALTKEGEEIQLRHFLPKLDPSRAIELPMYEFVTDRMNLAVPGVRARLTAPTVRRSKIIGLIDHADESRITVVSAGGTRRWVVPAVDVKCLELSRGRHDATGSGMGVGLIAGGILGVLFLQDDFDLYENGEEKLLGFIVFLTIGTTTGYGVGAGFSRDDWQVYPLDRLQGGE